MKTVAKSFSELPEAIRSTAAHGSKPMERSARITMETYEAIAGRIPDMVGWEWVDWALLVEPEQCEATEEWAEFLVVLRKGDRYIKVKQWVAENFFGAFPPSYWEC